MNSRTTESHGKDVKLPDTKYRLQRELRHRSLARDENGHWGSKTGFLRQFALGGRERQEFAIQASIWY